MSIFGDRLAGPVERNRTAIGSMVNGTIDGVSAIAMPVVGPVEEGRVPGDGFAVETSTFSYANESIVNNASPNELVCSEVVHYIGSCVELANNRLTFRREGIYLVTVEGGGTSFTPSANGRFEADVNFVDSVGSIGLSGSRAAVPLLSGVVNQVNTHWTRAFWSDPGGYLTVTLFQVSGANRNMGAAGDVMFLGSAPYPF